MLSIFEETIFRCRFWVFPLFPFVNFPQVGAALAAFVGSVLALRVQQCLCFFVSMILCFFVICIFSIYSDPFHREGDWAKVKSLVAAEGSSSLAVQVGATKVQPRCSQVLRLFSFSSTLLSEKLFWHGWSGMICFLITNVIVNLWSALLTCETWLRPTNTLWRLSQEGRWTRRETGQLSRINRQIWITGCFF